MSRTYLKYSKQKSMKPFTYLFCCSLYLLTACSHSEGKKKEIRKAFTLPPLAEASEMILDTAGTDVSSRFIPPRGFKRQKSDSGSFAFYLQHLPLKPHGSKVQLYNDLYKFNQEAYLAVMDLPIGKKDLHQCADAVMRLRADYLWHTKQHDRIHFNFTNGFRADYSKWKNGQRIKIKDNKAEWVQTASPSDSYSTYWKYLEIVFTYAGTYSLSKELTDASKEKIEIGDVFIQGGFPGHAIIVIDAAQNKEGEKVFMLAQSFMPAQELHILTNPVKEDSPWYSENFGESLHTPEWEFSKKDRKQFSD